MSEELTNTLESIVNNAFSTVLALDPILNPAAMVVSRGQPYLTSTIQITGAWKGVVSISVPVELGVQIAAIMFEEDADCIDSDDLEDALGEYPTSCRVALNQPETVSVISVFRLLRKGLTMS